MAVAPTAIPLPSTPAAPASVRTLAGALAWKALTPALVLLGRALASDYARDAERARDFRAAH
jgi:hypothetical protein